MIEARKFVDAIKPYKPGRPIDEVIRELGLTGEVIKLASNENPLGVSPRAAEAIQVHRTSGHIYPDDNCHYLKQRLSEKLGQPSERIIVGNGSVELIELINKAYVNPDDEVIISEPSFIMYRIACLIYGGKRISIPLADWRHDVEAIIAALTPRTKMVILDNPNNPVGTIVPRKVLDSFIHRIPADVIVVIDQAYREYINDSDYPDAMEYVSQRRNVVVLQTFSKIYGLAGLRVGYGIAHPDIIATMMKVHLPFNVNALGQAAAAAALDDQEFVDASFRLNETGKAFLYEAFESLGIKYVPTHGNFVLIDVQRDAREVFEAMQRRGVIIRTVSEYGLPRCLRVTVGTAEQNRRLVTVLKEVLE